MKSEAIGIDQRWDYCYYFQEAVNMFIDDNLTNVFC